YHGELMRKGLIFSFAVQYVDKNRDELNQTYPDFDTYDADFNVSEEILGALKAFASEKKEMKASFDDMNEDQIKRLNIHLKSLIASDLWETNEFYQINNRMNDAYLKALELLRNPKKYDALLKK
ncbi:MAG TPA: hypothetical protein VJ946_07005, partial [Bacteroidales bacterium]|nr:hypothetical protein [Bacteroidales bacterium]